MKKIVDKNINDNKKLELNLRIKNLFMQIFAELLYDYKYYSYTIDGSPVFNKAFFIKNKEEDYKKIYDELVTTQIFQVFLQNQLDNKDNYFKKRLSDFEKVKNKEKSIKNY